jgi:hypothetical protein
MPPLLPGGREEAIVSGGGRSDAVDGAESWPEVQCPHPLQDLAILSTIGELRGGASQRTEFAAHPDSTGLVHWMYQ